MSYLSRRSVLLSAAASFVAAHGPVFAQQAAQQTGPTPADTDWRHYANDLANTRYAPLDQINADNFKDLEVAWRFKTDSMGPRPEYRYECTPLVIKGRLYATAGTRRAVVCLDAATGELKWMQSIDEGARGRNAPRQLSGRGLSYWTDGKEERILYVTLGYQLVALDAKTGAPIKRFGENGIVDLKKDNDQEIDLTTGEVGLHATPLVAKNTVIVGAAHLGGGSPARRSNVKGNIRGFDVRTGKRKWTFHGIPRKGEFGYDSWLTPGEPEQAGNTGSWAQMSADEELNTAYIGIELPTGDEVGIYRDGPALFGETIIALDLDTGKRKWHYQMVHHGVWDHDVACAAILCDIPHEGKIVKALAQPSKQCFLYVLNRVTGEPIWPIPEVPQPKGDVPGEWYSPTQPIPSKPPHYGVTVSKDTIIDFTPELHRKGLQLMSHYRTGGVFEPPTLATVEGSWGTLQAPGFQGGTNWPGGCYDPQTHKVFVFAQNTAEPGSIIPGDPKFTQFEYVRGAPGAGQRAPIAMGSAGAPARNNMQEGPQAADGFRPGQFTIDGMPLLKPPYGTISAINLDQGTIDWQIAHGETPDVVKNHPALKGKKIPRTGQQGIAGPTVTKTLVICGEPNFTTTSSGARGAMLRAYDKFTGEEKGAVYMPAPQGGAPMTYMAGGRQYIVVAISGVGYSGELLAFRLPRA